VWYVFEVLRKDMLSSTGAWAVKIGLPIVWLLIIWVAEKKQKIS
jgi:hypothetical protein